MTPTPTTSQSDVLDFCSTVYQLDPVSIRRVFLLLIRNHFADPRRNFGDDVPDSFYQYQYFDERPIQRGVDIKLSHTKENWTEGYIPAVIVSTGDLSILPQSVLDKHHTYDTSHDHTRYVEQGAIDVAISHYTRSPDESLKLGIISMSFLNGIRPRLQQTLKLMRITAKGLSQPNLVSGAAKDLIYRVDATFNLMFNINWVTNIESHRIKKINLNAQD